MKQIRKILVVIDPTRDRQPALARAVMLAKACDAEVELYISFYYSYLTDIAADFDTAAVKFSEVTMDELRARLAKMAGEIGQDGVKVETRAEWKPILDESIIEEAERYGADLIVKDTHYHTAISRALFTNTDWNLIRKSPLPLWLVKARVSFEAVPRLIACIDPVNGADKPAGLDEQLLAAGSRLAELLDGRLYAFHAFNALVPIGEAATWAVKPEKLSIDELNERLQKQHAAAFNELAERHGVPPSQRLLKSGAVKSVLPGTATELDASLVIMGAVTRHHGRSARIGRTAESVMDHLPCDLLVLKSE